MAGFNTPSQLVSDARRVKKNGWDVAVWLKEFSDWKLSNMLNLNACPEWLEALILAEFENRKQLTSSK